ncbi:MAG: hypothetical protein PHI86_01995 [Candidatus Omnitrophica bacterium]|nr:hypothetical protein [Candidatus Omnitrophota bacterium]HOX54889.1 hypothetical protein [Candidatus Omnitrophota bacterium]
MKKDKKPKIETKTYNKPKLLKFSKVKRIQGGSLVDDPFGQNL